ncbi:hypothetical protein MsAg5_03050 [Methanosarcinaceae archaeon Ag5]|uniref:Polymer-forming cytoskeletal protein n=1 Tax=Methanolapillus africanus TaxID=3028297 RepID=A0AAE4MIG7_9EURY|nr:hypothetical protein [Methanosarcinaceae archaeon Ag5]
MTLQTSKIRFYPSSNTYVIPKGSFFDDSVVIHGNMIAGPGVHFWKNVAVEGNAQLGKGCTVTGTLKAKTAIIGAKSNVDKIKTEWNVSVFQNTTVNSIDCGGHLVIMDGSVVGYANAEKTLEILGKADIKKLGPVTKVTVRTDEVRLFEDHDEEDEEEMAIENELAGGRPLPEIPETEPETKMEIDVDVIEIESTEIIVTEIDIEMVEETDAELSPETSQPNVDTDSVAASAAPEGEEDDAEIISGNTAETVTKTVIETGFGPVTIEEYSYDTNAEFDFGLDDENGSDDFELGCGDKTGQYETGAAKPKFLKHTSSPKKAVEPEDDDAEIYEDEKKESSYVNFNRKRRAGGAELIYDIERDGDFDPTIPADAAKMYERKPNSENNINNKTGSMPNEDPFKRNGLKYNPEKYEAEPAQKMYKPYDSEPEPYDSSSQRTAGKQIREVQISEFIIKQTVVEERREKVSIDTENYDRDDAKMWYEDKQRSVSKIPKKEYPPYI